MSATAFIYMWWTRQGTLAIVCFFQTGSKIHNFWNRHNAVSQIEEFQFWSAFLKVQAPSQLWGRAVWKECLFCEILIFWCQKLPFTSWNYWTVVKPCESPSCLFWSSHKKQSVSFKSVVRSIKTHNEAEWSFKRWERNWNKDAAYHKWFGNSIQITRRFTCTDCLSIKHFETYPISWV